MTAVAALRGLFDPPVAVAVAPIGRPAGDDGLFEAERRHVARAVPKRRAEFASVRACARDALAELGGPRAALVPNPDRSPRWHPSTPDATAWMPASRSATRPADAGWRGPAPSRTARRSRACSSA